MTRFARISFGLLALSLALAGELHLGTPLFKMTKAAASATANTFHATTH